MASGEKPKRESFAGGDWTVFQSRNLLVRGQEQVRLEPRVMDVLVYLAERGGEVIPKEELLERVWDGRFVTDDVLAVTIYALRKALGDDARHPRYLETVSRRGYRWIASAADVADAVVAMDAVEAVDAADSPGRDASIPAEAKAPAPAAWSLRQGWRAVAATAALALLASGAAWVLRNPHRGHHVPTAEAHEAYVKGRYFLDQRSIKGWQQALEQFERAVALDPKSPAALAGLADSYSAMSDFGVASPAEMRPRAMKAARRALELDPESAEGLAALGRAQFLFDWDFLGAQRRLERALALDPDYMPAYQTMAWLKSARGLTAEAEAAARRALQLDPVNTARYRELAWVLALGGRSDEAQREIDRALALNPRSFETFFLKGWTHELAGQPDAAFAAYREGLHLNGVPEDALRRVETIYRSEGLAGYYRGWLNARPRSDSTPISDTWRAMIEARVGDRDKAIESLRQAYQKREGALAWVNVEPSFRPLRSDPRFQQIASRIGAPN